MRSIFEPPFPLLELWLHSLRSHQEESSIEGGGEDGERYWMREWKKKRRDKRERGRKMRIMGEGEVEGGKREYEEEEEGRREGGGEEKGRRRRGEEKEEGRRRERGRREGGGKKEGARKRGEWEKGRNGKKGERKRVV